MRLNGFIHVCMCVFRLHDSADYPWRPAISHSDFQKLLHNLTAVKIRGTYSEKSRVPHTPRTVATASQSSAGSTDDVLISLQTPATWTTWPW